MRFLTMLALAALAGSVQAEVELQGLLLNQTRTFAGQAFYTAFVDSWQVYDPDSRYSLVVTERPSARTGSQITVRYGDQVVYQQVLHFNASRAQKAGQAATAQVFERVMNAEVEEVFGQNPDMARDEIRLN